MVAALLIGRDGSKGFPGKNTATILGRPMMAYPILAAQACRSIERLFVSTDSPRIREIATQHGIFERELIDRPADLCTDTALGEDVVLHGYRHLTETLGLTVDMLVLLLCNSPTIHANTIETGCNILRLMREPDSVITVSRYNMWSPLRARKLNKHGFLDPFVPFETFGDPATLTCDRDSQGDVWYADMGMSIMRPRCFDNIHEGLLPQRWMGKKIYALERWGGLDIDYPWQVPQAEYWLRAHGFTETKTPYDRMERRLSDIADSGVASS